MQVKVNGRTLTYDGDPSLPLLWFLRDEAGLTGTKFGCGQALCGACTVHLDGSAVRSCITAVADVGDQEVTTIEGLHPQGNHPVQIAWRELQRAAMWVLPSRPDHAGRLAFQGDAASDRRADQGADERQHLSVRLLPTHRRRECAARPREPEP